MPGRYRIKEHNQKFTPQRRLLGLWLRMAPPQRTIEAASEIIRGKLKAGHPPPPAPPPTKAP